MEFWTDAERKKKEKRIAELEAKVRLLEAKKAYRTSRPAAAAASVAAANATAPAAAAAGEPVRGNKLLNRYWPDDLEEESLKQKWLFAGLTEKGSAVDEKLASLQSPHLHPPPAGAPSPPPLPPPSLAPTDDEFWIRTANTLPTLRKLLRVKTEEWEKKEEERKKKDEEWEKEAEEVKSRIEKARLKALGETEKTSQRGGTKKRKKRKTKRRKKNPKKKK